MCCGHHLHLLLSALQRPDQAAIQLVAGELGLTVGTLAGKRAAQAFKEHFTPPSTFGVSEDLFI